VPILWDLPSQVKIGARYCLLTGVVPMEFHTAGIPKPGIPLDVSISGEMRVADWKQLSISTSCQHSIQYSSLACFLVRRTKHRHVIA
jgi:hypothetical protein